MFGICHSCQSRHRLALASGGDDDDFIVLNASQLVNIHKNALWDLQIAKLAGHRHYIDHAPAGDGHPFSILDGNVHDSLDPVDVGSKGGNDNTALGFAENRIDGLPYRPFRGGIAPALRIGAVGHHQKHTVSAQHRQLLKINGHTLKRRIIDLKVPRMKDHPFGRMNGKTCGVRNGMGHPQDLDFKLSFFDHIPMLHIHQHGPDPVFLELVFDHPKGQPGAVYRHLREFF